MASEAPEQDASGVQQVQEEVTLEFQRRDNIYAFMLIYPELCRVRSGSYFNVHVGLAFLIFLLNILLQVSLTYITGFAIMKDNLTYRNSLLAEFEELHDKRSAVESSWHTVAGWGGMVPKQKECCRGHHCPAMDTCCAPGEMPQKPGPSGSSDFAAQLQAVAAPHRGSGGRMGRLRSAATSFFMKPGGGSGGGMGKTKAKKEIEEGTTISSSLCVVQNHTINCAQPSLSIRKHWQELDYDGDGFWTREEAEADLANLACVLNKGIRMDQAFDAVVRGVATHLKDLQDSKLVSSSMLLTPEVKERTAIDSKLFKVWSGLTVLCSARDVRRCGQLILDGIFDGAMAKSPSDKGFIQLEDALNFCQTILNDGGSCEKAHPVTYLMWRQHSDQMCGKAVFNGGDSMRNPFKQKDVIDLLHVNYDYISQFDMANSMRFRFFVTLILFVWYVNLLGEYNDAMHFAEFVVHFPTHEPEPNENPFLIMRSFQGATESFRRLSRNAGDAVLTPRGESIVIIKDITFSHKVTIWIMIIVRFTNLVFMGVIGTIFLLTTYSYTDLLMNAVALAFVFELPEVLYTLLVAPEQKHELERVRPLEYKSVPASATRGRAVLGALKSNIIIGLIFFPILAFVIVTYNAQVNTAPISEALHCACNQMGPRCLAAESLTGKWWDQQWGQIMG